MRDLILQCLTQAYGLHCYVEETDGGWIISIVNPQLFQNAQRYDVVLQLIDGHLAVAAPGQPVVIVYKLFIYANEMDQYCVQATLHTQESGYENDMHTTSLGADDAYVLIREADSEYIMIQEDRPGYSAKVIDGNFGGLHLNPANQNRYVELEFNGFFAHDFQAAPTPQRVNGRQIWSITFDQVAVP